MWIKREKLNRLLEMSYKDGYNRGFQIGQLHAMKEILHWRRVLESEPMGILVEQIEEILRWRGI